jgi:hypothetical protein
LWSIASESRVNLSVLKTREGKSSKRCTKRILVRETEVAQLSVTSPGLQGR